MPVAPVMPIGTVFLCFRDKTVDLERTADPGAFALLGKD